MNIELINRPIPSSAGNAKRTPSPLPELCNCTPDEGLARLDANRSGLTAEQVEARLEQYGHNAVTHEKPPTWYRQLFHAFLTPFNGVLFAVSVVSLFSDVIFAAPEDRSFRTIIVLITMVLLSTLLRFWQEFRSNKAAEELESDGDIDHRSVACWNGSATGHRFARSRGKFRFSDHPLALRATFHFQPLSRGDCRSSVGLRVEPSRSSIAGRRDAWRPAYHTSNGILDSYLGLAIGRGEAHAFPDRIRLFSRERENIGQEGFDALHRAFRPGSMRASPCVFRRRSAAGSKPEKTTSGCFRGPPGDQATFRR